MLSHAQVAANPLLSPFRNVYDYIHENHDALSFLLPNIQNLEARLIADMGRKHLTIEQVNTMSRSLLAVVKAANEVDMEAVNGHINIIKQNCTYSRSFKSKWTLLGCAIGAMFETIGLMTVMIVSHGAALPFAILNIFGTSFIGAFYGHKVGQFRAKIDITTIGKSIHSMFMRKGLRPDKTVKDFHADEKLIPVTRIELANKLAAIYYQNLDLTSEDVEKVLQDFLTITKQDTSILNDEFINALLNKQLADNKYCLKTLLSDKDVIHQAVKLLKNKNRPSIEIKLSA